MSTILGKIQRLAGDPGLLLYRVWAKTRPEGLVRHYVTQSRKRGVDGVYFILSFDCDTEADIAVVEKVHARLQGMGITPVYAVPGDMLRRGEKTYRRICESGAQFINHGDVEHTQFDQVTESYTSCFFYDEQSLARVRKDILDAHRTLQNVLGVTARGFRAPHFGTFQKPAQLRFMYGVLRELGYDFSTSTAPIHAVRRGAMFDVGEGLIEIPVSGMVGNPFQILDSWGFFAAPGRTGTVQDYVREVSRLATTLSTNKCGIINIYADPSHIHDQESFFDTVSACARAARSVSYTDLPGLLSWAT